MVIGVPADQPGEPAHVRIPHADAAVRDALRHYLGLNSHGCEGRVM